MVFRSCLFTQCILPGQNDCYWVKTIYKKMGGNVSRMDNCCDMAGVTCEGDKVIRLIWFDEHLSGSIPPQIGKLSSLMKL